MGGERLSPVLAVGGAIIAAILCLVCLSLGGAAARAWLGAAFLCAAAPTGAVGLAMMIRVIPGPWRRGLSRPLEGLTGVLPAAALAITPALIVPGRFFPWVGRPGGGGFREAYLSPLFFLVRGVVWLALLAWLALRLRAGKGGGATAMVGLIVYVLYSSLIAVDWLMSLDPEFASSGFGLYGLALQMNLAMAVAVAVSLAQGTDESVRDALGSVLLSSTVIWAYLGFMQYIISWTGDLPANVSWFRRRDAWSAASWIAIGLKFGAGSCLIVGRVRRDTRALGLIALLTAAAALPEVAWLALPAAEPAAGPFDAALFVASAAALAACGAGLFRLVRPRTEDAR